MPEKRIKNLVVASVVTAVSFLVILIAILIYQMVCLTQLNKQYSELKETEEKYLQLQERQEDEISLWLEEWKIEEAARKLGFRKNNN